MSILLLRHGLTEGNLEHRYIGSQTDEPLCPWGRSRLMQLQVPPVRHLFVSPMRRCIETAALLYPELTPVIIEDFRECHFGRFEGLSYSELNGDPEYQRWIDSGGTLPFPGGESVDAFKSRCVSAFQHLMPLSDAALVIHGGTIMAILEHFARPPRSYFDYHVDNGKGYLLYEDGSCVHFP